GGGQPRLPSHRFRSDSAFVGADGAATLDDADVSTQPVGASLRVEIVALLEAVPVLVAFVGADGPVPAIRALLADGAAFGDAGPALVALALELALRRTRIELLRAARPTGTAAPAGAARATISSGAARAPAPTLPPMTAISPSAGVVAADQGQSENAHHEEPQGKTHGASVSPPCHALPRGLKTATSGHKKRTGEPLARPPCARNRWRRAHPQGAQPPASSQHMMHSKVAQ